MKATAEIQKCASYVSKMSDPNLDKEEMRKSLLELDNSSLISIVTLMEVGRERYLNDITTVSMKPINIFSHHRSTVSRHPPKSAEEAVDYVLSKILLRHYMSAVATLFGLI